MVKKLSKPVKDDSQTARALGIYKKFLKQVEDGEFDESRGFRATVLAAFDLALTSARSSHSSIFAICQKRDGRKVNRYFEIVPSDEPSNEATEPTDSVTQPGSVRALTAPIKMSGTGLFMELELVPKQGPTKPSMPAPSSTAGTGAAMPLATPAPPTKKSALEKAEKVHTDLIDLCEDEISEAFCSLEELIDNVDQLGDAKILRTFVRKVKSACKQIEDQLATKTKIDRMQANKILVGLKA